jgi:hypothetical protein
MQEKKSAKIYLTKTAFSMSFQSHLMLSISFFRAEIDRFRFSEEGYCKDFLKKTTNFVKSNKKLYFSKSQAPKNVKTIRVHTESTDFNENLIGFQNKFCDYPFKL